ncbi:AraC family transcriptional regulator [Geothrix sp. PMB-07]|uniref:AraC family transcriptional regulator n=1 Tax=Geothrix sp. PMB-07 TaxID=3068640 RepID=UPI002741C4CF|nr:AraC family transcriptional regulator [Geothrix sp. PMB-07]WLT33491.1 AraC family transcriptional regulator [Geothrix sp. PMB-07]
MAHTHASASPRGLGPDTQQADLANLTALLKAHAPYDGVFELRLPGVFLSRASQAHKAFHHAVQRPALCLVAQGAKRVMLGQELFEYDASRMLIYSVDVPVAAQVTEATLDQPFLGIRLNLDPSRIADLTSKVYPHGLPKREEGRAICVDQADSHVLNAVVRLLELASQPGEADLLAPLVIDEILIRLLRSPLGRRVAQIGQEDGRLHRVSKAVAWVRANFDQPLDVERLATLVHMSPSSFHQHFKAVTSFSPLQYQKALRLQEARRLMLHTQLDAGLAAQRVGYQSASQFSREYGRYFGNTPTRDMAVLREQAAHSGAASPDA